MHSHAPRGRSAPPPPHRSHVVSANTAQKDQQPSRHAHKARSVRLHPQMPPCAQRDMSVQHPRPKSNAPEAISVPRARPPKLHVTQATNAHPARRPRHSARQGPCALSERRLKHRVQRATSVPPAPHRPRAHCRISVHPARTHKPHARPDPTARPQNSRSCATVGRCAPLAPPRRRHAPPGSTAHKTHPRQRPAPTEPYA